MSRQNEIDSLNNTFVRAVKNFKPPERLTVSQWAEKNRRLSPESSAEAGPWRNERTPYLVDIMDAFTDPKVNKLTVVAASQVGKSEVELNIIGYIIDQDPGSTIYVQPTLDDARKFSRLRIAPMIRDSKPLRKKVSDVKTRDSGNTILQKSFPGGMLTITGSSLLLRPAILSETSATAGRPAQELRAIRGLWQRQDRRPSTMRSRSRYRLRQLRAPATLKTVFLPVLRSTGVISARTAGSITILFSTIFTLSTKSKRCEIKRPTRSSQ